MCTLRNFVQLTILISITHGTKFHISNNIQKKLALHVLKEKPVNMVVSTLGLRFTLCKLASIADIDTKIELLSNLGLRREELLKLCYPELNEPLTMMKEMDFIFFNKLYVNYTNEIDPNFITNSSETYGVQVEKIGFNYPNSAVSFINRWVNVATLRRVTDVVNNNDISTNTTMISVNVAYLGTSWEFPFDIRSTKYQNFRKMHNKLISVPMMTRTDENLYYIDTANDFKILSTKLSARGVTMTIVLPTIAENLPGLLKKMYADPNILQNAKKSMRWTDTKIVMPRFKIRTVTDWTEYLKKIGVTKIFNSSSSGLDAVYRTNMGKRPIVLNKIKQKISIDVDETGAYRHLPEGMDFYDDHRPTYHPTTFVADRPFYFTVDVQTDEQTYDLFNGVYYGPE